MFYLKTEHSFDSAHFLQGYEGKCSNIHGHRWKVVAKACGDKLSEEKQTRGMVMDFKDFKETVKNLCIEFDHALIYESGSLKETTVAALNDEGFRLIPVPFRPTAENFAFYFYNKIRENGINVHRVEVYETPVNCAAYEV